MSYIFIYITASSNDEAKSIASALLDQNLIACANIFPEHTAMYKWEGALKCENETTMIIKTRAELFVSVKDEVIRLHSYDCPCIVSWPIENGPKQFLDWIDQETDASKLEQTNN